MYSISSNTNSVVKRDVGSEFRINTFTAGFQEAPSTASLSGGGFVVVWYGSGEDSDAVGIYGQIFTAEGMRVSGEFLVNTNNPFAQNLPSVAGLANGGFVAVWQSDGQDGDGLGIYLRRFGAAGERQGPEIQVHAFRLGSQELPHIAALLNGGFIVVWDGPGTTSERNIWGRLFDAQAQPMTSQFRINTYITAPGLRPRAAALAGGGFIVVWDSEGQDFGKFGVYGQQYDAVGKRVGEVTGVSGATMSDQLWSGVSGRNDGGFTVAWQFSHLQAMVSDIYCQQFGASWQRLGDAFRVNTYTPGSESNPRVITFPDAGFIVVWRSKKQGDAIHDIHGQQFSVNGSRVGSEFVVNIEQANVQRHHDVAVLTGGNYVIVWQSLGEGGDGFDIHGRILEPITATVTTPESQMDSLVTSSTRLGSTIDSRALPTSTTSLSNDSNGPLLAGVSVLVGGIAYSVFTMLCLILVCYRRRSAVAFANRSRNEDSGSPLQRTRRGTLASSHDEKGRRSRSGSIQAHRRQRRPTLEAHNVYQNAGDVFIEKNYIGFDTLVRGTAPRQGGEPNYYCPSVSPQPIYDSISSNL